MTVTLDAIRECLDGAVPGVLATCAPDGTPNVSYLSQVEFVDAEHVALSFQFFNRTRQNVLANPRARLMVVHPTTAAMYRLSIEYLRTETDGALFERMKAKLAGIASHHGMTHVFRLRGADVYRVHAIESVPGEPLPSPPPRRSLLASLRQCTERLAACTGLNELLAETLACLDALFEIRHATVFVLDAAGARLYAVASRGYEQSGVGSEIPLGAGVIGVAAREATPIRIGHATSEYAYGRAIRQSAAAQGLGGMLETEIPLPGLAEPRSQLAVPIRAFQRTLGVLYVESPQDVRFTYDDEDALVAVASALGLSMHVFQQAEESTDEPPPTGARAAAVSGAAVVIRHYAENDSVFLNDDYLIKGVAGAIFWLLVSDYAASGRTAFSNRELRVDPRLRLPDVGDNLEARLVLLQRRLEERGACLRIEKAGRGRLTLVVQRPVQLVDVPVTAKP